MDKNLQKRVKYQISLIITGIFLYFSAHAQTVNITGKITSADDGQPIPGVSVKIKGTGLGTVSSVDGSYNIAAEPGKVLVFSFLGFAKREITVKQAGAINVKLNSTSSNLNEVVVIGYGKSRRPDVTGSISSITGTELRQTQPTTFDQALQGKVAGVVVQQISGQPGGGVSIQIRGVSSISGANAPLVVIDGVIIPPATDPGHGSNPLSGINPNDIESLDVLKDASATAIYGSQATNGVIVITTKRGKAGRPTVNYDFYTGYQEIRNRLPTVDLQQLATFLNARAQVWGYGTRPELANPQYLGKGTDWQSELFRKAPMTNHTLSVSGGDEKTQYYISGSYFNQQGIALGSAFKRYSVRLNLDTRTTKWLKLGTSLQFFRVYENTVATDGGVIGQALSMTPDVAVKNADGSYGGVTTSDGWVPPVANPVGLASLLKNESARYEAYTNAYAEIQFTNDLSFRTEVSGNFTFGSHNTFNPVFLFGTATNNVSNPVNSAGSDISHDYFTTWRQYLTFNHNFKKSKFNILGGHEANTDYYENISAGRKNFVSNNVQAISAGDPTVVTNGGDHGPGSSSESYFGRVNFSWDDKYLITGNLRNDGSSNFPVDHNWAVTYSGAFAWKINNETFLKSVKSIDELKLRLGYGLTNNQGIPGNTYATQLTTVPTGLSGVSQFQSNLPNPDVTWEKTNYYNAGVDATFFNGRINFSFDAYDRETKGLLLKVPLPEFSGTTTGWSPGAMAAPYVNVGSIRNRGFDFRISTTNTNSKNFTWKTDLTFSRNVNTVLSLGSGGSDASLTTSVQKTVVGQAIGEFYGYLYDGIFAKPSDFQNHARPADQSGKPYPITPAYGGIWYGDRMFKDLNGDGIIDTRDQTFLGSPLPKFQYGFNNSFTYKNFGLNIFFSGNYGNKVYNQLAVSQTSSQNNTSYFVQVLDYAKYAMVNPQGSSSDINNVYISNPNTSVVGLRQDNVTNYNNRPSDLWIEDASFLRCKNIRLDYNFSESMLTKIFLHSVRVYANVSNVFVITKYKGMDPEIGTWNPLQGGVDGGNYPMPRVFTIGASLTFNK